MEPEEGVVVKVVSGEPEAEVVCGLLHGDPREILVRAEDLDAARELLAASTS